MTVEEMRAVMRIVGYADGGCSTCVKNLVEKFAAQFPQFAFNVGHDIYEAQEDGWFDHYVLVTVRET